jgi:hypothetical protein
MSINLYAQKILKNSKIIIAVYIILINVIHSQHLFSQVTVSTTGFTNNNVSLAIVFNFQNTNSYDVMITEIASIPGISGVQTATAWFIPSPTTGTPSGISAANGWTMIGQNPNFNGVANTTTNTPHQTMITGMSLIVPANTTYRMALELSTSLRYSSIPAGVYTFSNGGCNIITGTDIGYAGAPSSPTNSPRGFIGSITFIPILPCSGTPNPGNSISSVGSVCPNTNFNLSISNSLVADQSYQWQSAPSSSGPWTNISGATSQSNTQTQLNPTWYRNSVTCNSSGQTAFSTPVFVDKTYNVSCLCASAAIANTNEDITNVTFGSLNNSSTCSTTGSNNNGVNSILGQYSNFTHIAPPTVSKGQTISLSVTTVTCGSLGVNLVKAFIDYNQNGSFADAGEEVFVSGLVAGGSTHTGNVTIPVNALTGNTIMRVVNVRSTNPATVTSCSSYNFGETEDYTIYIDDQVVCSGTPNPGNTISSAGSVCPGAQFNLSLQNQTSGTGVTYQWQSADDITFSSGVQNIGTTASISTTQSSSRFYRCIVTCNGNSGTSTPVQVTMNAHYDCYCAASANSAAYESISNFTFGTINNTSSSTAGYESFTGISTNISAGSAVPVSITITNPYSNDDRVYVWVDVNQNGLFESPSELFYQGLVSSICPTCNGSGSVTLNGTITLPISSLSGITGLRVRLQDNSFNGNSTSCGNSEYGQVEDYRVNITVPVTCSGTPSAGTAQLSSTQTCSGNSITATLNGNTSDYGIQLQWESSFNGSGFSNISGATANSYASGALSAGNYQYRCKVTCSLSGLFSYSNTVSVSVLNSPTGNTINNPIAVSLPYSGSGNNLSSNCWTNTGGQASPDVYYSVTTGQCANILNISLCGAGTLSDSYLSILDVNGNVLATADDDGPFCATMQASISTIINPSTTYVIRVEGYSNNMGTYSISINQESTPTTTFYVDNDGDGYGNPNQSINVCYVPSGYVSNNFDCNDANPNANPSRSEICGNSIDDNCNGQIDEGTATNYYTDNDNDGYGSGLIGNFCSPPITCDGTYSLRLYSNTWGDESGYTIRDANNQIVAEGFNLGGGSYDYEITFSLSNGPFTVQLYTICTYGDNQPNFEFKHNGNILGSGSAGGCNGLANVSGMCSGSTYGVTQGGDCNDNNPSISPGLSEICNGVDDNCNGQIDEGLLTTYYADNDGDGYGNPNMFTITCSNPPTGYTTNNLDCDDSNAQVNPGQAEICNSIDDNCDGIINNGISFSTFYQDLDGDGFGNPNISTLSCDYLTNGWSPNNWDCNDNEVHYIDYDGDGYGNSSITWCGVPLTDDCDEYNNLVYPGAPELCDFIDNNCNDLIDEGLPIYSYYHDIDADGFGNPLDYFSTCLVLNQQGWVTNNLDCNDLLITYTDNDGDGFGVGSPTPCGADNNYDCDDNFWTYPDNDEDGYGSSTNNIACGYYDNSDCDDYDASVYPGSTDFCGNNIDDNCNGLIDEYCTSIVSTHCGQIYNDYNTPINAIPVNGATAYKFRIYNIPVWQNNFYFYNQEVEKLNPTVTLNDFPPMPTGTLFYLEVAAKVNGEYGGFSTYPCPITTDYQPISLAAYSCGITTQTLADVINSTIVEGASQYVFKIVGNGIETIINSQFPFFTMNQISNINYSTTYTVQVAYYINGNFINYGPPCSVTTPGIPIPQINPSLCGTTLVFISNAVSAITGVVNPFEGMRWKITGPNGTIIHDTPGSSFVFTNVPGFEYSTTYIVEGSIKTLGQYGPYGPACSITTPSIITQIQPSQCGITLSAINTNISANQVQYATQYRFRIVANGMEQFLTLPTRTFNLTQLPVFWYSTIYQIQVQAEVGGVWGPYGVICNITTPAIPTAQIQASQCGIVLANENTAILSNLIVGATNYYYKISWNNTQITIVKPASARWFYFSSDVPNFSFGTSYQISVAAESNGVIGNYGPNCIITLPQLNPQIQPNLCGTTLTSINTAILASLVQGATQYRYKISSGNSEFIVTKPASARWFYFNTDLPQFFYDFTYNVSVSVEHNGVFSNYGPSCSIKTPLALTQIQPVQCGTIIPLFSTAVLATLVPGATNYRYRLTNGTNVTIVTRPASARWFRFNELQNIQLGTTYQIDVAVETNGIWGPYGPVCNVTTPLTPSANPNNSNSQNSEEEELENEIPLNSDIEFNTEVFPNPFTGSFYYSISTSSLVPSNVKLYDLNGKELMSKICSDFNQSNLIITENLSPGIYFLKITQDNQTKVHKIVKATF